MNLIGIDIGGTKIAAGLVAWPSGCASQRRIVPTQAGRGGRAVLNDVVRVAAELADQASTAGNPVKAIGIGICELVNRAGAIVSANCIHWLDAPVCESLSLIAPAILEA